MGRAMLVAGITILVLMLVTWVISVAMRNASIVDIVWGLGFVVVAWAVRLTVDQGDDTRQGLLVGLTTVWGLRLASHLLIRNHGGGEDFRYRAMRRHYGDRFALISGATVFGLQGVLMFVVSLPVQLGQADPTPAVGFIAWIGIALWLIGMFFETVGDLQLARFKANPASKGLVMNTGLWRYTRHPNYFGDACVWWGIGIVAAETGAGALALIGPAVMTFLLRRVSGVTLLERSMAKRRPGYTEYVATTSPFLPRPPRPIQQTAKTLEPKIR